MKPGSSVSACRRAWVHRADDGDRIAARGLPHVGVDPPEEVAGLLVPRPAEVSARDTSGVSDSGSRARTVKLRSAFTTP